MEKTNRQPVPKEILAQTLIKLAILLTILALTMLVTVTKVSAWGGRIDYGQMQRSYENVYGDPCSLVTFPNLVVNSWNDIRYVQIYIENYYSFNMDRTVPGCDTEFDSITGPAWNGTGMVILRFPSGVDRYSLERQLRTIRIKTNRQATNPSRIYISYSSNTNAWEKPTGDSSVVWNGVLPQWSWNTVARGSSSTSDGIVHEVSSRWGSINYQDTNAGAASHQAKIKPPAGSWNTSITGGWFDYSLIDIYNNMLWVEYPGGIIKMYGDIGNNVFIKESWEPMFYPGHSSNGRITFSCSGGTQEVTINMWGTSCATTESGEHAPKGGRVTNLTINWDYSYWLNHRQDIGVMRDNAQVFYTIPKQYPVSLTYVDNYGWSGVPGPQRIDFQESWITNPAATTTYVSSAQLYKTGYTWDKRYYGYNPIHDTRQSEGLNYNRLLEFWRDEGYRESGRYGPGTREIRLWTGNDTANKYNIVYNDNKSWNKPNQTYSQQLTYNQSSNLMLNQFTRNTGDSHLAYDGSLAIDGYTFLGWTTYKDTNGTSPYIDYPTATARTSYNGSLSNGTLLANGASVLNLTSVPDGTINLYPNWVKTVRTTINLNNTNAKLNNNSQQTLTYQTKIYNALSKTINLTSIINSTGANLGTAYGTPATGSTWQASNGLNQAWVRTDQAGPSNDPVPYRFLGLSTDKNSSTINTSQSLYPTSLSYNTPYNFSTYTTSHANQIEIVNDSNLYAIWEPILTLQTTAIAPGIKTDKGQQATYTSGTKYNGLTVPGGTKVTLQSTLLGTQLDGQNPVPINLAQTNPYKFSEMYTPAFQNQYPTITDKLNTAQTFTDSVKTFQGTEKSWSPSVSFSIPAYIGTAEYHRLTGTTYNKDQEYRLRLTATRESDYARKVNNEQETVSTELIIKLPQSGGSGGDSETEDPGADNTPNKVKLHLNLHTNEG